MHAAFDSLQSGHGDEGAGLATDCSVQMNAAGHCLGINLQYPAASIS